MSKDYSTNAMLFFADVKCNMRSVVIWMISFDAGTTKPFFHAYRILRLIPIPFVIVGIFLHFSFQHKKISISNLNVS